MSFDAVLLDAKDRANLASQGFASLHPGLLSGERQVLYSAKYASFSVTMLERFVVSHPCDGRNSQGLGHPFSC
jgi:hypothetical protein